MERRLEQKNKYKDLISQSEQIQLKKGSKKFLRMIVKVIIATNRLFKESISNKLKRRNEAVIDITEAALLYNEIASGWIMRAIKKPLISILGDPTCSFNFIDESLDTSHQENRLMKVKVRAKGILCGLIEHSNSQKMPTPLIIFLGSLTKAKAFVPDNFLTPFELNRLKTDAYGALITPNED